MMSLSLNFNFKSQIAKFFVVVGSKTAVVHVGFTAVKCNAYVQYTVFINGRPVIFCFAKFSKQILTTDYQTLQNLRYFLKFECFLFNGFSVMTHSYLRHLYENSKKITKSRF